MHRQLLDAASFAARAHHGQFRKDRVTPYASHPFRVCMVVRDIFGFDDPRMLITALLHDTLEDTTTDYDDLEERYGAEIATWVASLSKDTRLPDEERERAYTQCLKQSPWQVQVCKLADIFDNLMDSGQMSVGKRAQTLKRSERYFAELASVAAPAVKEALAIVQSLIDETRGTLESEASVKTPSFARASDSEFRGSTGGLD